MKFIKSLIISFKELTMTGGKKKNYISDLNRFNIQDRKEWLAEMIKDENKDYSLSMLQTLRQDASKVKEIESLFN